MKTNIHFFIISRSVVLIMRNVADKIYRESRNTYCRFRSFFFPPENRVAYDIKLKKILSIRVSHSMPVACWIPKAKNTLSEYVIVIAFSTLLFHCKKWLHERASILRYTYCLSCLYSLPPCSIH